MGSGRWLTHLVLALAVACGGHSRGQAPQADGGASSTGGHTSTAGATSSAGAPTPQPCTYQSLAALCDPASCPNRRSSEFEGPCAPYLEMKQATTACGGTAVNVSTGYGDTTWYYDPSGALTGIVSVGDVYETCADGHLSSTKVYGTTCEVDAPWRDGPCTPIDRCDLPPVTCDGVPNCNESIDAVLEANCNDAGALSVTSSRSRCGGTLILVDRGNGAVRYCFSAQNALVGMSAQSTGQSAVTLRGSDCYPEGDVAPACPGNAGKSR